MITELLDTISWVCAMYDPDPLPFDHERIMLNRIREALFLIRQARHNLTRGDAIATANQVTCDLIGLPEPEVKDFLHFFGDLIVFHPKYSVYRFNGFAYVVELNPLCIKPFGRY